MAHDNAAALEQSDGAAWRAAPLLRIVPRRPGPADVAVVVGLGGGTGSVLRYLVERAWPASPTGFPWATFSINVTGCLLLGALMVFVNEVWRSRRYVRLFLGVGVLGGYTTFSTFALETRGLAGHGQWLPAAAYAVGSPLAGVAAVALGAVLARATAGVAVRRERARRRPR